MVIWSQLPAETWNDGYVLGNGRIGATIWGPPHAERVGLNEEGLWAGGPVDSVREGAHRFLPEIRRLIFAGKHAEATALAEREMFGVPNKLRSYQKAFDVIFETAQPAEPAAYRRELDLTTRQVSVNPQTETSRTYTVSPVTNGVLIARRGFVGAIRFDLPRSADEIVISREKDAFVVRIHGRADDGQPGSVVSFGAVALVRGEGLTVGPEGDTLIATQPTDLRMTIGLATDLFAPNPRAVAETNARKTMRIPRTTYSIYLAEWRTSLTLGREPDEPTDARLAAVKKGRNDVGLEALMFTFGRYLALASAGALPPNLQGIWNDHLKAPWDADFHVNINLQMNMWPNGPANMPEANQPLFDLLERLREKGARTAREHYGCRGWVVHHNTDPFGQTAPMDQLWGFWMMGGPWLALHVWDHYLFTLDKAELAKRWPILAGAARFAMDFLVQGPDGKLTTCPSHSPENAFRTPNGETALFTFGATMDLQIIRELLQAIRAGAKLLGRDADLAKEARTVLDRLTPMRVSARYGTLQEWQIDYEETEPGHRHISHAFGLYPGTTIDPERTPELAQALEKTIARRLANGGGGTGWSLAWLACLYARLGRGDDARRQLVRLLREETTDSMLGLHPPRIFQIDANFGACAAIAEMLIQSHRGRVDLLPALPTEWHEGHAKGLLARGDVTVDIEWDHHHFRRATLTSPRPKTVTVTYPRPDGTRVTTRVPLKKAKSGYSAKIIGPKSA